MTPEELLRQTSATSRTAQQQKQIKQQKIRSRQNPHAVALPYDGDRGLQQIQLSDGSIQEAQTNSNGVIGEGDTVALHQGKGRSRINAMPHKPKQRQPVTPQSVTTGSVKILFSDVAAGVRRFFVGGDRQNPIKIFELPEQFVEAYITNTGRGVNNWIASFRYGATTKIITPSNQWEYTSEQSLYTQYKGGGFWASDLIVADASVGDFVETITPAGTLDCGNVVYTLSRRTITGRVVGVITPSFLSGSVNASGVSTEGTDNGSPPVGINVSEQISESRTFEAKAFGLFKGEFSEIEGARTYTIEASSEGGCSFNSSSTEQNENISGENYLTAIISKDFFINRYFRLVVVDNPVETNEESKAYYTPTISGANSQSAIALKTSETQLGQNPDAGYKLITKTEDGLAETAIAGTLPTINLATMNLVGSKIYQVPVSGEYKTKKVEVELDVFAIAGTISQSKKKAPIFSLKSQGCTIHSASAFL